MNKTKVIIEINNSNNKREMLKELIINGIDLFLLNLNKIDENFCLDVISNINNLNDELNTNVAIMLKLRDSNVHLNRLVGGSAYLRENDKIRIYMNNVIGDDTKLSVDYKNLIKDISYNSKIIISDGLVELKVLDKGKDFLLCSVIKGGNVYDYDELSIPGIKLNKKFLTNDNIELIKFAANNNIDYIILDSVSGVEDVLEINDLLISIKNSHLGMIACIENEFALDEIDDIINICEGIVIARDELGVSIPIERIPGIQKLLINKCHLLGKISVVSTEINFTDSTLTKAEVSDVANAVLDGTDAIIIGNRQYNKIYSIDLLKEIEKIIEASEENIDYANFLDRTLRSEKQDTTGNIAGSVASMAAKLKCKAIVAPTSTGYTARKMSRFRPYCPIIAISTDRETIKSLAIYFGVYPILIDELKSLDDIVKKAKKVVTNNMDIVDGDKIIITGGYPFKGVKHTNLIEIEEF